VFCKRPGFLAAIVILSGACGRPPAGTPLQRLAVLRFENLSGDASADWIGRALSEVVSGSLVNAPGLLVVPSGRLHSLNTAFGVRPISAPGISSERTLALAAGATRIAYGQFAFVNGRLETRLTVEDPQSSRMVQVVSASSATGDVIETGTELARGLSSQSTAYGTRSMPALKEWVTVLESSDPAAIQTALAQCLAADPDFAPAYLALAQWKSQRQDRAGAMEVLTGALARGDRIPERDRVRMQFELAGLRGDSAGQQRALTDLLRIDPRDPAGWRALGQAALNRRDYPHAIEAWQKSVDLEEDPAAENQLAYAAAYAGDLNTAVRALRRYQSARPADPNAIDSLGDVHLITGHLKEAENFYREATAKNPEFLNNADYFKAAMARLMAGDVPGADALAKQYADARAAAHDPLADVHRAEWSWISGRRKDGYDQLLAFARSSEAGSQREAASRAYAELAIWYLLDGDRGAAAEMAGRSAPLAGPSTIALSLLSRFLAQPPTSPDQWTNRAGSMFPAGVPGGFRELAVAYALLLDRNFEPASMLLQRVYNATNPTTDEGVSILLAWSLVETGRAQQAAPLLKTNPVPPPSGVGPMMGFYFPRLYELRARAAEKLGNTEEARTNQALFQRISGSSGGGSTK
jgi:tetratricopeptide (TPR) repeat protein